MIDRDLELETADGVMTTFVTHPEEGGPHPVVLLYMDALGKREELHDIARRLGTAGYYVVVANLYYRWLADFNELPDGADRQERMRTMIRGLDLARVTTDTEAMFALVDGDPAADAGRMGVVGYCMSGPFAYAMAGTFPDRIRAAASVYGVAAESYGMRLHGEGSPEALAGDIKAELYFACAEIDNYAPADRIAELERHLDEVGADFRIEWYPGAYHGFAFPSREGAYDKPAAERHFERLHALFDRRLRS